MGAPLASAERGVYPCPFGFALNVPLQRRDRLVPVVAADAAALAPLADALSLVRSSGGFDANHLSVPTAEIRFVFERVPDRAGATRRLRELARDLLTLGHEPEPGLEFQPALELRCPEPQALSVHLYVEGTSSAHQTRLARLADRIEPMLRALIDAPSRVEAPFVLRRRVLARCKVDLAQLFASLPERARDAARETQAVQQALRWLAAARSEPRLAVAQNELVLGNAARVARALDDDGRRATAEGHCHAARFGAAVPLASFAAAGASLRGALELPLAFDVSRRTSVDAALASGLMRGASVEDVAVLSTCLGLAAQLASVKAAISLALSGVAPLRASETPVARVVSLARERRPSLPPPAWARLPLPEAGHATPPSARARATPPPRPPRATQRPARAKGLADDWRVLRSASAVERKPSMRPPLPAPVDSVLPKRSAPPALRRRAREDSGIRPAIHVAPARPSAAAPSAAAGPPSSRRVSPRGGRR